jgi:putative transposase
MHERKKQRLPRFDYSAPGAYFVTICVKNMQCRLGEICKGNMVLNEIGEIVKKQWNWLFKQYCYTQIDEFTVMPNHLHGIIHIVGNGRDSSLQVSKVKSIPELVGAFKTTSSKTIHLVGHSDFRWQKSYYERVVRDEKELHLIREYINNNPISWELEKSDSNMKGIIRNM